MKDFPTTDEEINEILASSKFVQLPEKYQTPDWIWEDEAIDQLAREYVEGVKKCNYAPTWDLIHTAVCYGYGLAKSKS